MLIGVAYLTIAAVLIDLFLKIDDFKVLKSWLPETSLLILFAMSIFLYRFSFKLFWTRLMAVTAQIVILFFILLVAQCRDNLSILYFIIVPMAFLAFNILIAVIMVIIALGAIFLDYLIVIDLNAAISSIFPYAGGFAFFAVATIALIRQQKDRHRAEILLSELEEAHLKLHDYSAKAEELAVAEERNRIAREIHDSLGHHLTAMTMQLQVAGKIIAADPDRAADIVSNAEQMARNSLNEVRRSVAALRTSPVETTSLSDAINELVSNIRDDGITSEFITRGKIRLLPIQVKTTIYRAVQEGLTNVRKHSSASSVSVLLAFTSENVSVSITDNGTGRRNDKNTGFGLVGLRERVSMAGGSLNTETLKGGGFKLEITIPLKDWDKENADE